MVDIDEKVCKLSEEWLAEWGDGCWSDPRFEVHYEDAVSFLENEKRTFDVIIMDIADPLEAGPAIVCYTKEYYETIKEKLSPNGIFVTQSGPGNMACLTDVFTVVNKTLNEVFPAVFPYHTEIPSFVSTWGFNMAFKEHESLDKNFASWDPKDVDEKLKEKLGEKVTSLRHYDGISHRGLMNPSKYIRDMCEKEERISTKDNPQAFSH